MSVGLVYLSIRLVHLFLSMCIVHVAWPGSSTWSLRYLVLAGFTNLRPCSWPICLFTCRRLRTLDRETKPQPPKKKRSTSKPHRKSAARIPHNARHVPTDTRDFCTALHAYWVCLGRFLVLSVGACTQKHVPARLLVVNHTRARGYRVPADRWNPATALTYDSDECVY